MILVCRRFFKILVTKPLLIPAIAKLRTGSATKLHRCTEKDTSGAPNSLVFWRVKAKPATIGKRSLRPVGTGSAGIIKHEQRGHQGIGFKELQRTLLQRSRGRATRTDLPN